MTTYRRLMQLTNEQAIYHLYKLLHAYPIGHDLDHPRAVMRKVWRLN